MGPSQSGLPLWSCSNHTTCPDSNSVYNLAWTCFFPPGFSCYSQQSTPSHGQILLYNPPPNAFGRNQPCLSKSWFPTPHYHLWNWRDHHGYFGVLVYSLPEYFFWQFLQILKLDVCFNSFPGRTPSWSQRWDSSLKGKLYTTINWLFQLKGFAGRNSPLSDKDLAYLLFTGVLPQISYPAIGLQRHDLGSFQPTRISSKYPN